MPISQADSSAIYKKMDDDEYDDTINISKETSPTEFNEAHLSNIENYTPQEIGIPKHDTIMKRWGKKLQKLALKLKNPAEEERLKKKIDLYLQKTPEIFTGSDDETVELKRQLPNNIVKTLKRKYLKSHVHQLQCTTINDAHAHKKEKPKYYSRCIINNLENIIGNWLKMFHIKKEDVLGRPIDRDYIYYNIMNTLEPLVLNRAKSDEEFLSYLKSNVTNIVNDLPIIVDTQNKDYYLSNLIDALVNEIQNMDNKFPISYIQPTTAEIRHFVKDQITFFLERTRTATSRAKKEHLEKTITEHLLDLTDVEDLNSNITDDLSNIFVDFAKMSRDDAKYYTKIMLNDYREFFFRQHYFTDKASNKFAQPEIIAGIQNKTDSSHFNKSSSLEMYMKELVKEINEWLNTINTKINDRNFQEIVTKNLAYDIVGRRNYLMNIPNYKSTVSEEMDYLKYQIFKRLGILIGEHNATKKRIGNLIERLNLIPTPLTFDVIRNYKPELQLINSDESSKLYIENLTDVINTWFHNLPIDEYSLEDTCFNRKLMENLAKDIERRIVNKESEIINRDVDRWIIKMFNRKLSCTHIQQLKDAISTQVETRVQNLKLDLTHEKIIGYYKDIIDKWLITVPLQANKKEQFFKSVKNGLVFELAIKLHNMKNRLTKSPIENVSKILQEEISNWMKKLPLNEEAGQRNLTDTYAELLANNIKTCTLEDSNPVRSKGTGETLVGKVEAIMLDSLKNLPTYLNKNKVNENHCLDDIKSLSCAYEDETLQANIEDWVKKLPIHIVHTAYFKNKKNKFIAKIKQLRLSGANDDVIVNEIIHFMKTLPMEISQQNNKRVDKQSDNLKQTLFSENVLQEKILNNEDNISKTVENVIKQWATFLEPVVERDELTLLLNEVTPLILKLFKNPERLNEKHYHLIRDTTVNVLKKHSLDEYISEQCVSKMVNCLINKLKDIGKNRVTVSACCNSEKKMFSDNDTPYVDTYAKQIVQQMREWMNNFSLFKNTDEVSKVTIMNDLVRDIIDGQMYLEPNPQYRENFRTHILNCVHRLFDHQKVNTMLIVEDLMKRIESISLRKSKRVDYICMQTEAPTRSSVQIQSDSLPDKYSNSKEAIFDKYQTIFKKKVYDLPIDTPTPESAQLAELARAGIYNGILKLFFSLKFDQEFENHYGYFELILERKLDEMLDLLPQTDEMKRFRHGWKVSVLKNALDMLKEMQAVSDRTSFRQLLQDGFSKKLARNFELEQCYLLQQGFLAEMAEAYILESKYKEEDPIKSNIYKQRLMKQIDEMAKHMTTNIDFRYLKKPHLIQHAMKILHEVPIPSDDISSEEVETILLRQEIEQWYKELPTTPYVNDFDQIFRKRMIDILAVKLHEIETKRNELDKLKERDMKNEISKFLVERDKLQQGEDLNTNYNKNLRTNEVTDHDSFEKKKPASSTLANMDNSQILVPLIDCHATTTDQIAISNQTNQLHVNPLPPLKSSPRNVLLTGPQCPSTCNSQGYSKTVHDVPYQWPAQVPTKHSAVDLCPTLLGANMDDSHSSQIPPQDKQAPTSFCRWFCKKLSKAIQIESSSHDDSNDALSVQAQERTCEDPNQCQSLSSQKKANAHDVSTFTPRREYQNGTYQKSQNVTSRIVTSKCRSIENQRLIQSRQDYFNVNENNHPNRGTNTCPGPECRLSQNYVSRVKFRDGAAIPFRALFVDKQNEIAIDKSKCVETFKRRLCLNSYPCPYCVLVPPYRMSY